jgi:FkbM family methyltransferase
MKINLKIKQVLFDFIPKNFRINIFYKIQLFSNLYKMAKPRIRFNDEYLMALDFHNYYIRHTNEEYQSLKNALIKNLDNESVRNVEKVLERHKYILHNNVIEQSKLFTENDIKEQKKCSKELMKINRKYKPYNFSHLSSECFYGYSGLRWLPQEYAYRIKDGICIDGGACEGDTAVMLIEKFKAQEVHAFEIEKNNYKKLSKLTENHFPKKITPKFIGLSDQPGYSSVKSNGFMSILKKDESVEKIKLETIDNLYKNGPKISLIKLDTEGAESKILKGAEKIIKRDKPILAISIYHNPEDFFLIKPWIESINPNYKFIIRSASPFALIYEIMLIAY